jgi:rhodanese-related sulfurtransferase
MIKSINSKELKEKLDAKEDFILIDCREQNEWDAGHIAQAKFIPLSEFKELYAKTLTNKEAQIVMQCRSGKRSFNACQFLLEEEFENLINLEDGIMGWENNGFEIIK